MSRSGAVEDSMEEPCLWHHSHTSSRCNHCSYVVDSEKGQVLLGPVILIQGLLGTRGPSSISFKIPGAERRCHFQLSRVGNLAQAWFPWWTRFAVMIRKSPEVQPLANFCRTAGSAVSQFLTPVLRSLWVVMTLSFAVSYWPWTDTWGLDKFPVGYSILGTI